MGVVETWDAAAGWRFLNDESGGREITMLVGSRQELGKQMLWDG